MVDPLARPAQSAATARFLDSARRCATNNDWPPQPVAPASADETDSACGDAALTTGRPEAHQRGFGISGYKLQHAQHMPVAAKAARARPREAGLRVTARKRVPGHY